MPAQKAAAAKRKAPSSPRSPAASSKRRSTKGNPNSKSVDGAPAPASLLQRWAAGVAAQLVSPTQIEQRDSSPGVSEVQIDVEGAGRAAVDALPPGKLRTELLRDAEATTKALQTQVEALRAKQRQQQGKTQESLRSKKKTTAPAAAAPAPAPAPAAVGGVVPCTARLYRRARAAAAAGGDTKLLKALAVNPRAPLDLLVDAVGAGAGRDSSETLESAVAGMETLATALAADPRAAVSLSGVKFYADRAASLASSAATAAAEAMSSKPSSAAGAAAEACGLMLRILQIAGLAVNNTSPSTARVTTAAKEDGDEDGEESSATAAAMNPADRLLLPCSPEASSSSPPSDVALAAAATATAGAPAATKVPPPPPPARLSVSRLLAHYAVTSAVCSTARGTKGPGVAAAFVRSARAAATGKKAAAGGGGAGSEGSSGSSSSSSSSDDEDDDDDADDAHGTLSQHLSALCATTLSGDEPATLEFLRCVGDATCAGAAASPGNLAGDGGARATRAALAAACSRALGRLPRPAASPPATAAQFLKRAYAFRVVELLNRSAAGVKDLTASGRASSSSGGSNSGGGGGDDRASSWDFVGAGAVSPALLNFLERPEASAAVGKGPAGAAVEELASCRRRGNGGGGHSGPAGIVQLLRSSPACSPHALSVLLSAMEQLEGGGIGEEDGGGGGTGGDGVGEKAPPVMGGFFLDTRGTGGAGAGVGVGSGTVLGRLGSGGVVADMDEVEVASAVSSALSDGDGDP
eukprot:g5222.t1